MCSRCGKSWGVFHGADEAPSLRLQVPRLRQGDEVPPDQEPRRLRLPMVRASGLSHGGHDLPQVHRELAALVLGDLPNVVHPLRDQLPDRPSHVQADPQPAHPHVVRPGKPRGATSRPQVHRMPLVAPTTGARWDKKKGKAEAGLPLEALIARERALVAAWISRASFGALAHVGFPDRSGATVGADARVTKDASCASRVRPLAAENVERAPGSHRRPAPEASKSPDWKLDGRKRTAFPGGKTALRAPDLVRRYEQGRCGTAYHARPGYVS